jgi:hypothetical protein
MASHLRLSPRLENIIDGFPFCSQSYSQSDGDSSLDTACPEPSTKEQRQFSFFPALPAEIRLIIWEYTWPEARVIEAATHVVFTGDEATELTYLRPAGSLAALLRTDVCARDLDIKLPLEICPSLVTLAVCRESREHTLKHYIFVEHSILPEGSFYFNPFRDIIWLSWDLLDDTYGLQELEEFYNESIGCFKTLLIQETEWEWGNKGLPDEYTKRSFSVLRGLETVLLASYEFDNSGKIQPWSVEERQSRAEFFKGGYEEFLETSGYYTASCVQLIDCNSNVY